jgi:hypothetical protein
MGKEIDAQIARFPDRFCLSGFPGKVFTISRGQKTKAGIFLCIAVREDLDKWDGTVVHQNGVSTFRDGRWVQHGRLSPDDLADLIEIGNVE